MLNQVVLVGRLTKEVVVQREYEETKYAHITLAVPRAFKNSEGEYETDFIKVTIFNGIAESTAEYCKKGDLIGIKGHVQCNKSELQIIADRISFLSSNKKED